MQQEETIKPTTEQKKGQIQKRYQLWGPDLKVGLQAILEKPVELGGDRVTHDNPAAPIVQDYQTGTVLGEGRVLFSLREYAPTFNLKWKLEFARKAVGDGATPRLWMVAGRFDEARHFGFSSIHYDPAMQDNGASKNYFRLSAPSETYNFPSLYVKVEKDSGCFIYLMIDARAMNVGNEAVLVTADEIAVELAPPILRAAKKRLTYAV